MKLYDNTTENGQNYRNPVLYMDYSDPDVIRVGEDYYMVASSFTYLPGVPLLHSRDLIHWEQLAWCVEKLPFARYDLPAHGCGTWAPAIRYHDGMFYVFIPLPDEGIFVTTAKNPAGPWSELHCIKQACGWIDPCPFWDDDGNAERRGDGACHRLLQLPGRQDHQREVPLRAAACSRNKT